MYKYLANTVFTGKKIEYLPTCHSTNNEAKEIAKKSKNADGIIVITDNQTSGKGQRGNTWESAPEENLTFSVIYHPHFLFSSESFYLNIITSLALVQALKNFNIKSQIKWPNDIYAGSYKISGILIENSLEREKIKNSIIGIGLNVNQSQFSYPQAASMYTISNRTYRLQDVLEVLVSHLEQLYLKLKSGNRTYLREQYHKHLLGIDQTRTFIAGDQEVIGIILGVDEDGRLKVEIAGNTQYFSFKEIKFIF
ncbi:MAG: biotin--[acetyl-CoA-carboxylase] ligase [Candidatus Cyclobacteriaceae bacterium M2_1C_046]